MQRMRLDRGSVTKAVKHKGWKLEECQKYRASEYTKTSRIIYKGPCVVCCVMVAGDGANADCQVYDGESANDKLKAHIEALSGTTFHWGPGLRVKFHRGIYVAVNAATTKVTVTFSSLPVKETE